jgi:hypothetical protein
MKVRQKSQKNQPRSPAEEDKMDDHRNPKLKREKERGGSTKELPTPKIFLNSKKLKGTLRRMMRKPKKEAWEDFVGSINARTSSQEM